MISPILAQWGFFGFILLIATIFERRNPAAPTPVAAVIVDWKLAGLRSATGSLRLPVNAGAIMIVNAMGGGWIHLRSDGWWFLFSIILVIMTTDLLAYFIHRAQHTFPVLWAMHSLHHSAEAITVITGARHFWLEFIVIDTTVFLAMGILFKIPPEVAAIVVLLFLLLGDGLAHLNMRVSFGRFALWLNNPQYHRIHHSIEPQHQDKNFCKLLPLMDVIFGTAWKPAKDEFPATGLATGERANGFLDGILWPIRRNLRA